MDATTTRRVLKHGPIAVLASAVLVVVSACGSSTKSTDPGGTGLTKIDLVIPSTSSNQAVGFIASNAGIFEKNGLDVTTTVAGSGALATAALIGGSADFVITGGSDLFEAQDKGQKLDILAKALSGQATQIVLTPEAVAKTGVSPDAPVAERVKALNGLTLASPSEASSWTSQANLAAKSEGATIKWTYIQPTSMAAAMKQKQIDGISAAPPYTTDPIYQKTGVLWLSGPDKTFPGGYDVPDYGDPLVATTQSYANANPKIVQEFVKSIYDVATYVKADSDKAGDQLKKALYPTMAQAEWDLIWKSEVPQLADPTISLDQLSLIIKLDGADVSASDMYPADLLKGVSSS